MKKLILLISSMILGAFPFPPVMSAPDEPSFDTVEKMFRELPKDARRATGPLFWLHGDESQAVLERELSKVSEGGNGCFTTESRPHNDWLGAGWFRDLDICLNAAKKHDLKMWIFDEEWWPSQMVGGKVPPQYGSKIMTTQETNFVGPIQCSIAFPSSNIIAVVAGRKTSAGLEAESLVDLNSFIANGTLTWSVPQGEWKVMIFTWQHSGARGMQKNNISVDGADPACVDWFLKTVYQPHYDRYKKDFGRTIAGFFYDEPETHGDWGPDVMSMLAERHIDWKQALVSWKYKLAGEAQISANYQYQDALAESWGRTMYGGMSRWCRDHQVQSIGHFMEHANGYLDKELCAGNMFQLQKYSDMGALDAVFAQFAWGKRVTSDAPVWQTPKLCSSITHAYGKKDDVTMVEIFGARGQDLTYPEMKWWVDHMQVSGVNFMIPHSFNPRAPYDTDCPPYFYNGGFEPRWPLYRVFADYNNRISTLLTGGRHVASVALLFLGNSKHSGKAVTPEQMSEVLQDSLFDCDWIPYDVLEKDITLATGQLKLRDENYQVLIVPPVEVIPYATLAKVQSFFEQGGVVLGHGFLPTQSATIGKTSADIAKIRQSIWGDHQPGLAVCKSNPAGGRSYLLPEKPTPEQLQQVMADAGRHSSLEVLEGDTSHWLHVIHRVKSGRDIFFIANQNHTGAPRQFKFRITAAGVPECWDPMHNEITSIPFQRKGDKVELTMTFQPSESVLLVFQPTARTLPSRVNPSSVIAATIPITREITPEAVTATPELTNQPAFTLKGCSWIWFPEGKPYTEAPAGKRLFRKSITLPAGATISQATFIGSADNSFTLFVNGQEAGSGSEWHSPTTIDIAKFLKPGLNQLAIAAINGSDKPNPAGLIGRLTVQCKNAETQIISLDASWKSTDKELSGWTNAGFDDSSWVPALQVAKLGDAPWGNLSGMITLSLVEKATPFDGHFEIPATIDLKKTAVYLEMDKLAPEEAARISINGEYAGGFIAQPLRIDLSKHLKAGRNTLRIEPFAPESCRLTIYKDI